MTAMEDDTLQIDCSQCGKPFEPTPDSFWECGIAPVMATADQIEELNHDGAEFMTMKELVHASPAQLAHFGLDEQARARLLKGEHADTGAMAVCPECAARIESEGKL
jgi:hypothetical protein